MVRYLDNCVNAMNIGFLEKHRMTITLRWLARVSSLPPQVAEGLMPPVVKVDLCE